MIIKLRNLRRFSTKFGDISKQQTSSENLPDFLRYGNTPGEGSEVQEILGLDEFKLGVKHEIEKDYEESEHYFKEALKMLKKDQHDKTLGYLYILKRLAYVSYLNSKFTDSEKYFTVVSNLMPTVSKNQINTFQS